MRLADLGSMFALGLGATIGTNRLPTNYDVFRLKMSRNSYV